VVFCFHCTSRLTKRDLRYNSQCITFIASKCDDVSCKEIITALKLRKDPALIAIDARISEIETKKKDLDKRFSKKQADITGKTSLEPLCESSPTLLYDSQLSRRS
jgi:hypothetical protein